MAYCVSCGKPYEGAPRFCPHCGQPLEAAPAEPTAAEPAGAEATGPVGPAAPSEPATYAGGQPSAPTPPPPQYPPQGAAPYPASPGYAVAAAPPRRDRKWLWIGSAVVVVVVAVVLVLVLVVFNGGGTAATGPEEAVAGFFDAMENKDIDAVFDLIDPTVMGGLGGSGADMDALKDMMGAAFFSYQSIEFNDIEMSTEMTGETTATVTITGGSVTLVDATGAEETQDVAEADEPVTINLVEVDGKWYLESAPFME